MIIGGPITIFMFLYFNFRMIKNCYKATYISFIYLSHKLDPPFKGWKKLTKNAWLDRTGLCFVFKRPIPGPGTMVNVHFWHFISNAMIDLLSMNVFLVVLFHIFCLFFLFFCVFFCVFFVKSYLSFHDTWHWNFDEIVESVIDVKKYFFNATAAMFRCISLVWSVVEIA